mmetsp:Transcript_22132/g.38836  ORF Transcript_22132/g.38836 Transcript_22132/m.38836 type:complete len:98 (-) Transcript_22132:150-443(-)
MELCQGRKAGPGRTVARLRTSQTSTATTACTTLSAAVRAGHFHLASAPTLALRRCDQTARRLPRGSTWLRLRRRLQHQLGMAELVVKLFSVPLQKIC